jgi:hypothetical protein
MLQKKKLKISLIGIYFSLAKSLALLIAILSAYIVFKNKFDVLLPNNNLLNNIIILIFAIGVLQNIKNILILIPEIRWFNLFINKGDDKKNPLILSPIQNMMNGYRNAKSGYFTLNAMKSILEIIESRLSDYKESSKYIVNILTFLGLLGTFWGLLITLGSISGIINNLQITDSNMITAFNGLKSSLVSPLNGMGVAFSSSFIGLICALILGFINLQSSLAMSYFYNKIEENLSVMTRVVGDGATDNDNILTMLPYIQALLEQTAEHLNQLQRTVKRNEDVNADATRSLSVMAKEIATTAEQTKSKLKIMEKMTKSNEQLLPVLQNLAKASKDGIGMDGRTKEHIRNIDTGIRDMQDALSEDIKILSKTIKIIKSE